MGRLLPDFPVTTWSIDALVAIHRFGGELVSHGCGTAAIFEAVAADPGCPLAQAYAGVLFLLTTTREGYIQAVPHIHAAAALASRANEREQMIVSAVSRWGASDEHAAAEILATVVERWPQDIVAAKLCQILQLGLGDFAAMRRTAALVAAAEADGGYALGLFAFALEQNGEISRAEVFARLAIERNPDTDPWAQHAYAHVLASHQEWAHGRAFMRALAPTWERCTSSMLTHNWWHAALFSIELGDIQGALTLFDEHIWGVRKPYSQDQVNAISLLARLEMRGVNVGSRWANIALYAAERAGDRISGFLDLHYLYALARAGDNRATNFLVAEWQDRTRADPASAPFGAVGRGVVAHARGCWRDAVEALAPVRRRLPALGGSQMQRALFDEIYADSLIRAGGHGGEYACA